MREILFCRRTAVFIFLAGATLLSWQMGHGTGFADIRHASTCIIALALIKIRYVILEFMELRHAPWLARFFAEAWVAAVCLVLVVLYWNGAGA